MPDPIDTTGMMLGEMKGQLREVIHTMNNMSSKMDALTREVIGAQSLPAKVEKLEERVTILEADKNQRDGAMGLGGWLMRSPLIAWLGMLVLAAWTVLRGKL